MGVSSTPVRLDGEIIEAARREAKTMSRSLAQQIAHWARLGRALEASPDVSLAAIVETLERQRDYDDLSTDEQAIVRVHWAARIDELRGGLRMDDTSKRRHEKYAELDASGNVVVHEPTARKPRGKP